MNPTPEWNQLPMGVRRGDSLYYTGCIALDMELTNKAIIPTCSGSYSLTFAPCYVCTWTANDCLVLVQNIPRVPMAVEPFASLASSILAKASPRYARKTRG